MVIYADAVFVLNTAVNWMLLRSTARLRGSLMPWWRTVLGAVVGGGYAVATVLPGLQWLGGFWGKTIFLVLMILSAFGCKRQSIATGGIFVLLSVGLCGAMYAVLTVILRVPVGLAGFYPATFSELLLTCAGSTALLALILRHWVIRPGEEIVPIHLTLATRSITLSAFRDTGNSLTDPMSGQCVPVIEANALRSVLGQPAVDAIAANDFSRALSLLSPYRPRLIPFRTVGNASGMLVAIRCEELSIGTDKRRHQFVALSPTPVSDRGDYHALIGGKL